jgi:hypothetical protein
VVDFNLFTGGNNAEAVFWMAIGLAFAVSTLWRRGLARAKCLIAAVVFVVFGGSDLVEVQTGAWWRPWWLFAWKAACVVAMFLLYLDYRRGRRVAKPMQGQNPVGEGRKGT